ncbi:MAG: fumarylacetoacetate hydrolase family protein [Deltaproteobacteria bacterium]|nr:fumarylacetoacetate hydrolase family protein [Deltaproteobacteria bacterium]MBW1819687.1 fumarylacetoacetate hydrolase family protein [Deltaproteobacteria bacterium]MBW2284779.1 fumarylacetoacetate hydrolase family protein [Deltaproteobacteria bacterium]
MVYEDEMKRLEQAEKTRKPIDPISQSFSGDLPLEGAYAICEGNIQRRLDSGEKIVGFKVGLTNIAAREKMGMPDSFYGYLLDSMVLESGVRLKREGLIEPRLESEICFKLKSDLQGKDLTVDDVMIATEGICASFEICDARIGNWACAYPDFIADNGMSCRVALGGTWHPAADIDLPNERAVLTCNGEKIAEGAGELSMGHPAKVVAWLAGKLADRGKGLKAGQIVMTGTLTGMTPMEKGAEYAAAFSTLGEVTLSVV